MDSHPSKTDGNNRVLRVIERAVPPVIDIENVTKIYEGKVSVRALNRVSLKINRGEFVAIVGASGSGKSTLMNVLGLLDFPSYGKYFIDGVDVKNIPEDSLCTLRNRKIGFIFQGFNLIPRTTALANVELPLIYAGAARKKRRRLAEDALTAVGLSDRMDHDPSELSGGQQQRVAIARAIVTNPRLVLADEPTGNLDSASTVEVLRIFHALHQQGHTIVLITHEPDVAAQAERVIHFKDGELISDELNDDQVSA